MWHIFVKCQDGTFNFQVQHPLVHRIPDRASPAKPLPRPGVQEPLDEADLFISHVAEIGSLREKPADEAVQILIRPALP